MNLDIRHLAQRDWKHVLAVEKASFDFPWGVRELANALSNRNMVALVAEEMSGEHRGRIAGYIFYELCDDHYFIWNLAVDPVYRSAGVGRGFICRLQNRLRIGRRRKIVTMISESNTDGHLFMKACGFRAVAVLRQPYPISDDDAYLFTYLRGQERWSNRVQQYMSEAV